jgi:spermidine synthase
LAYYYPGGAMAQAMGLRNRLEPSAIVGLGAGSALAWFDAGEDVGVYEIDPDVEYIAKNWFGFFTASKASIHVSIGDARLNLRTDQTKGAYGAMLVDAFSGDGIPVHLLTLEALDVYLSRLSKDGILVFHVSNRYYDLIPVLKAAAQARGLSVISNTPITQSAYPLHIDPSVVVMARTKLRLNDLLSKSNWKSLEGQTNIPVFEPWTDDYVTVLAALWSKYRRVGE